MIIRPGGTELFFADRETNGLTDMPQLIIIDVRSLAMAPLTGAPVTPRVSVLSVLACKNSQSVKVTLASYSVRRLTNV